MASQQLPPRTAIKVLFGAMLAGAGIIVLFALFMPSYVELDDEMTLIVRVVMFAAAALSVGQAFWLRARLTKQLPPEEKKTGTIQRQ